MIAEMKVVPERRRRGMWSLADLCAEMLQLELRKPSSLRTGSWEKSPLSVDQLFYAAADAYAGLRIWQVRCVRVCVCVCVLRCHPSYSGRQSTPLGSSGATDGVG